MLRLVYLTIWFHGLLRNLRWLSRSEKCLWRFSRRIHVPGSSLGESGRGVCLLALTFQHFQTFGEQVSQPYQLTEQTRGNAVGDSKRMQLGCTSDVFKGNPRSDHCEETLASGAGNASDGCFQANGAITYVYQYYICVVRVVKKSVSWSRRCHNLGNEKYAPEADHTGDAMHTSARRAARR